mgnify:CR=1 FL=1
MKKKGTEGQGFFSKRRGGFVAVCIGAFLLFLLGSMFGGKFGVPQQLTLDFIGTLQNTVIKTRGVLRSFRDRYIYLVRVEEKNRQLRETIESYRIQLSEFREDARETQRLRELLDLKRQLDYQPLFNRVAGKEEADHFQTIAARVVGREPAEPVTTIIVDRGKKHDVLEGMIALSPGGVVGQVTHVSEYYSKILLAIAPSSAIDALNQRNRTRGILKGDGNGRYHFHYVVRYDDIRVDDFIVTAGIGGVFPGGIPLGKVVTVNRKPRGLFQDIVVQPDVDFERLEYVLIDRTDRKRQLSTVKFSSNR